MTIFLNNDLNFVYLISGIVILTTGYFIKSYFTSTIIETPRSETPQTFNFTHEQYREIHEILDRGEELDIISWIKDTSIYKWYFDLFSKTDIISNKKEDIPSRLNEINKNSIENKTNSERNSRIIEWINRDSEKTKVNELEVLSGEELNKLDEKIDKSNYKYYFILGTLIITTGIVWYYWNDIKPTAGDVGNTIIEKVKSFRSWFNNDQNNIINNNPRNNQMDIQTNVNPSNDEIGLVDNTHPPTYNQSLQNKGKRVLTSPSLENLTEQAESSWGEGSSSPGSDRTITQASSSQYFQNYFQ